MCNIAMMKDEFLFVDMRATLDCKRDHIQYPAFSRGIVRINLKGAGYACIDCAYNSSCVTSVVCMHSRATELIRIARRAGMEELERAKMGNDDVDDDSKEASRYTLPAMYHPMYKGSLAYNQKRLYCHGETHPRSIVLHGPFTSETRRPRLPNNSSHMHDADTDMGTDNHATSSSINITTEGAVSNGNGDCVDPCAGTSPAVGFVGNTGDSNASTRTPHGVDNNNGSDSTNDIDASGNNTDNTNIDVAPNHHYEADSRVRIFYDTEMREVNCDLLHIKTADGNEEK